jgi:hypothetical protein
VAVVEVALEAVSAVHEADSVVVATAVATVLHEEAATVADTAGHEEDQPTALTRSRLRDSHLSGRPQRLLRDPSLFPELLAGILI